MKKYLCLVYFLFIGYAQAQTNVDRQLISEMLTVLQNDYIESLDMADMVAKGLQILPELDADFYIKRSNNRFYLYYKGNINFAAEIPNPEDSEKLTDMLTDLLAEAGKLSEKVELHDYALPDLFMQKIVGNLDEYSRYYSQYEYDEKREKNAIHTLYSDRLIDDILYLRIRTFNQQTAKSVEKSLQDNPHCKGIILDLRGNSGGLLNEALKVADFFTEDAIITYTAGRDQRNRHYYTTQSEVLYDGPLLILVDGETASAAEVLAGGLQAQSRAEILGTRTFGKGTIQNVIQMSNGSKLVLTTEQFFTPSDAVIHKQGIKPDICLAGEDEGCPPQSRLHQESDIEAAIKILSN